MMGYWEARLSSFLRQVVCQGRVQLRHADGRVEQFGQGNGAATVTVHLHDRRLARALVIHPSRGLGEAYMDGRLTVEGDDVYGLLDLLFANLTEDSGGWRARLATSRRWHLWRLSPRVLPSRARRNAAHHYDLPDRVYELFLDPDRQYSCAYFTEGAESLTAAQEAKKRHIAAKLLIRPGDRVLDVGCGWGGLALHLARQHEAQVTGITLSERQYEAAARRATASGVSPAPTILLEDYRRVTGTFERIVSVGMLEHVGPRHYREFFDMVKHRLSDDGVAVIHTIGRAFGPRSTDPWIAKYIFPDGSIPALSEIVPAVERAGLILTDVEVWRLHYAETLRAWRTRFETNHAAIRAICGERFCRMWRYYLVVSELAFRRGGLVVYQLQLANRQDAVPLTRDYLTRQALAATG